MVSSFSWPRTSRSLTAFWLRYFPEALVDAPLVPGTGVDERDQGSPRIGRDPLKIPNPPSNPVAGLLRDTLAHHGLSQAAAARAMNISPGVICDIIKDRKPVSTELALRLERCLGLSADFILKVQAHYHYCAAYHARASQIAAEVKPLLTA